MNYKTLQTNFQRELLYQIITSLKSGKLTHPRARQMASDFLPTLKLESPEAFIEKVSKLSEEYPEILNAFLASIKQYEKSQVKEGLESARTSILKLTHN